jgi:hypothetical protein
MATTATATLVRWNDLDHSGIFTLVLDTTDANGELTLDLTTWFKYIYGGVDIGATGTTGYVFQLEKPAYGTAITSTNVKVGVYEAGADAGALDAVASTDVSAYSPGLTFKIWGRQAV